APVLVGGGGSRLASNPLHFRELDILPVRGHPDIGTSPEHAHREKGHADLLFSETAIHQLGVESFRTSVQYVLEELPEQGDMILVALREKWHQPRILKIGEGNPRETVG